MGKVGRKTVPSARGRQTRQQIDSPICHDGPANVREILRAKGHPVERIVTDVLIPKLYAKKMVTVSGPRGATLTRLVDDNAAQIKAGVELLRMSGCYGFEKIHGGDAATPDIDCEGWSDDDLGTVLAIKAKNKQRASSGTGRVLPEKSDSMASRE